MLLSELLAAVGLCTAPSMGPPCTCIPGPPLTNAQAVAAVAANFDAIFEATVLDLASGVDSSTITSGGRRFRLPELRVSVGVSRRWKGTLADTVLVTTALDGTACGFAFTLRERYLIFATRYEPFGLATSTCAPTVLWGREAERLADLLRRLGLSR